MRWAPLIYRELFLTEWVSILQKEKQLLTEYQYLNVGILLLKANGKVCGSTTQQRGGPRSRRQECKLFPLLGEAWFFNDETSVFSIETLFHLQPLPQCLECNRGSVNIQGSKE